MEYKSTFTIPSVRIYMDELSSAEQDMVRLTFLRYNRMKEWYYNQSYNEKYLGIPFAVDGKTETALLKEHYRALYGGKLSDYYITSLFSANLTAYVIHTVFYFIFFFLNLSEMAPHRIFSVLFPAHDHAEYLV